MRLLLLDTLSDPTRLLVCADGSLKSLAEVDALRLDAGGLAVVGSRQSGTSLPLYDPFGALIAWRNGLDEPPEVFEREFCLSLRRWIEPRLEVGDGLLLLFRPGLPDDIRVSLLDELSSLGRLSLLAGVSPALLAAFAVPEYDTEDDVPAAGVSEIAPVEGAALLACDPAEAAGEPQAGRRHLGAPSWRLEAEFSCREEQDGPPRLELRELLLEPRDGGDGDSAALATAANALREALEGRGPRLALDLQPELLLLCDSDQDRCLSLGQLAPGTEGLRAIDPGQSSVLALGCGRGERWSGAEPLVVFELTGTGRSDQLLSWSCDEALELTLTLQPLEGGEPRMATRALPRPLLIEINRLRTDGGEVDGETIDWVDGLPESLKTAIEVGASVVGALSAGEVGAAIGEAEAGADGDADEGIDAGAVEDDGEAVLPEDGDGDGREGLGP
jgi:hypothetical protein